MFGVSDTEVVVVIDEATLRDRVHAATHLDAGDVTLPAETIRRLACDAFDAISGVGQRHDPFWNGDAKPGRTAGDDQTPKKLRAGAEAGSEGEIKLVFGEDARRTRKARRGHLGTPVTGSGAYGPWRVGHSIPCGRHGWPCAHGSRGHALLSICWVDRCAWS